MEKLPITAAGFQRLEQELQDLKTNQRPAIIVQIAEARAHGDLSENAEYHAAREKQSFIEGRIKELEDKTSRAEIFEPSKMSGSTVKFGATVLLVDEESEDEVTYQIVGADESDISKGLVSVSAPIARALIGKAQGDRVEVTTPKGQRAYEVLEVLWK